MQLTRLASHPIPVFSEQSKTRVSHAFITSRPDTFQWSGVRFSGQDKPERQAPWPEVPDELIQILSKRYQQIQHERWAYIPVLKKALEARNDEDPSFSPNDRVIHHLYDQAKMEEIRDYCKPTQLDVPGATLFFRPGWGDGNLRVELAAAVRSLRDDAQKLAWMQLLTRDPNPHVKAAGARIFSSLSTQTQKDEQAVLLAAHEDSSVRYGLAQDLPTVSAPLRWQLIGALLADTSDSVLNSCADALASFSNAANPKDDPLVVMLKAWHKDMTRVSQMEKQLMLYKPEMQNQPDMDTTKHDTVANWIGLDILNLNNRELYENWMQRMRLLAQKPSEQQVLARDVLSCIAVRQLGEKYKDSILENGKPDEVQREAWKNGFRLAAGKSNVALYLGNIVMKFADRNPAEKREETVEKWTPEQITVFEKQLSGEA